MELAPWEPSIVISKHSKTALFHPLYQQVTTLILHIAYLVLISAWRLFLRNGGASCPITFAIGYDYHHFFNALLLNKNAGIGGPDNVWVRDVLDIGFGGAYAQSEGRTISHQCDQPI